MNTYYNPTKEQIYMQVSVTQFNTQRGIVTFTPEEVEQLLASGQWVIVADKFVPSNVEYFNKLSQLDKEYIFNEIENWLRYPEQSIDEVISDLVQYGADVDYLVIDLANSYLPQDEAMEVELGVANGAYLLSK